uniref:Uncharacterized LOC116034860 n=1 Tax=Sander lucioperca TaxID=283035 RepID=A0A8C9YLI3_SANLU
MATEFTQDSLLYFLQSSGGTVKNSDLLLHFRHFIRDHADQNRNREQFKKFVNSLATVKQIDGVSYVVLRKKFKGHVTGGGEGGSSEPPRLCARKNTEPSPENAKLSPARSTEKPRKLPKIYLQDVERETMTPRGPGWSLESGVGQRGQWAGPGLEPGSSMVPLEPREHAWLVKGAAGAWPDIYTLFREDSSLLNRQDFISGFTVLHWIAKHGDHRVLNTLCVARPHTLYGVEKAGLTFNMNAKSTCGHTPLHIAAIHGNKNIMRLLVNKFNADVKLRDAAGKKAWQYLSSTTQSDVFQLLGAPSRPAGGGDGGVVREDQEQRQQTPRRRRHHLSFASPGESPK